MRRYLCLFLLLSLALAACEGARNNTSWSKKEPGTEIVPPLKVAKAPAESTETPDSTATADSTAADSAKASH
jgi:hypothetical protein